MVPKLPAQPHRRPAPSRAAPRTASTRAALLLVTARRCGRWGEREGVPHPDRCLSHSCPPPPKHAARGSPIRGVVDSPSPARRECRRRHSMAQSDNLHFPASPETLSFSSDLRKPSCASAPLPLGYARMLHSRERGQVVCSVQILDTFSRLWVQACNPHGLLKKCLVLRDRGGGTGSHEDRGSEAGSRL